KEIIKANAVAFYQDSAQPSVRILGKTLAQCVSLFATPIGRMVEIFENNLSKYIDKLDGLSVDLIKLPETRIFIPILEKLRYTDDEVVSNYYAQILATASTKEELSKVSVAFIEILNRMCADEIKMLEFINSNNNSILLNGKNGENNLITFNGDLPVVDVKIKLPNSGYILIQKNLSYLEERKVIKHFSNYNMYLDNMFALGLLAKPAFVSLQDESVYEFIKRSSAVEKIKKSLRDGQVIDFQKGKIETTELGKRLLDVASSKKVMS
ncbi:MAG: Abi-alpha family protein, partial [Candidatus Pacebacteria bacterium]|nr:Abi-alpha family protein [Candidatus Paceibacterota bacterium]